MAATGKDYFRKPSPGMWEWLCTFENHQEDIGKYKFANKLFNLKEEKYQINRYPNQLW